MSKRITAPDTQADIDLRVCLDKVPRQSFVMIAGAGSGKTTSLVKALHHIVESKGVVMKRQGQQVACITYTEIAALEIWNDVGNNPLVHVSTIHSFLWTVIRPFQADIKKWVLKRIIKKLSDLREAESAFSSRVQQRTREKNARDQERYEMLGTLVNEVNSFNYGTGSNYSKGILGHNDIMDMVPELIESKPMLGVIISQKFPYVFVDESQDTFPNIVNALKKIEQEHKGRFCLGFFGDPMQKIYTTGIGEISLGDKWITIKKPENFRCSQEVLKVINEIRNDGDGLKQTRGRTIKENDIDVPVEGSAHIFILPIDQQRIQNLRKVQEWSATKFNDNNWVNDKEVKIFVIVHRMAATRLGFPNLYSALNDDSPTGFKEGLLDGTAWPLRPLISFLLPLVSKGQNNKNFEVLQILREKCPLLVDKKVNSVELPKIMARLNVAVNELIACMKHGSGATILDALKIIYTNELYTLDKRLVDHMNNQIQIEEGEDTDNLNLEIESITRLFTCPVTELWGYKTYIEDESPFATQQGVKGAEFERVITILDDEEGTHNLFSYDKYFGLSPLSKTDLENIEQGRDNVIDRTRRLFYVSCSRAQKDLIVVYYTADIEAAINNVRRKQIFEETCIYTVNNLN
ncbi:UvrD-helicase domain-containing protein [Sediminibacterium sp.]|uniref:UvrD-helicase domain-containing protein n=1 Tax=Sediminibacterium sp. TaxID=1917865 RepID=UPI0026000846|nr:UvrD-helicase domain-containing protein [Sediminibacterium sp.]MBT9484056.1 ATP-dependent helicase [Sediminibacterium sp.]